MATITERTTDELKVILNGTIDQYKALTNKTGTVFFDRTNQAVYAEGFLVSSNVKDITLNGTKLEIYPISGGAPLEIEMSVAEDIAKLKTELENWTIARFVRFDVNNQQISDTQKEYARANIGAEAADSTILKQDHVVNDLTTGGPKAPLSATQGTVLKGLIDGLSSSKVDKDGNKQLSTEDFTTALKTGLESLIEDVPELEESINSLQTQLDTLVNADADAAIDTFNEIIAFLKNVENTDTLEGIIAGIETQIENINTKINNLEKESHVDKINGLSGEVDIESKTIYIDDTDGDGSGDIACVPIEVSANASTKKISLGVNRNGALGILAMALEQASKTNESWVRFDNIDVHVNAAAGSNEYHIELSSTPKVWKLKVQ